MGLITTFSGTGWIGGSFHSFEHGCVLTSPNSTAGVLQTEAALLAVDCGPLRTKAGCGPFLRHLNYICGMRGSDLRVTLKIRSMPRVSEYDQRGVSESFLSAEGSQDTLFQGQRGVSETFLSDCGLFQNR